MKLTIPVEPQPQSRPRFTARGRYVHAYENKKITMYKRMVAATYQSYFGAVKPTEKAIAVDVVFYRPVQKSISKIERQRRLTGESLPAIKPDIDNYVKAILDALNGVAFRDDKQIISLKAKKLYSDKPRTEIEIKEI